MRAGRVVPLDQIVDGLWPEHPPARAAATVQVFVSNLRRALEPDRPRGAPGTVLVTASRGYQLAVEPGSVDAQEFVRLAEQGRPRSTATIPSRPPPRCCAARWTCGGAGVADVPDAPFARAEAARLDELLLGAIEDRIDADLALGRHSALVAELELQVLRHPMREWLRAQLMLALYRCGRQADALQPFSPLVAIVLALVLPPVLALATRGRCYLRRTDDGIASPMFDQYGNPSGEVMQCHVCREGIETVDRRVKAMQFRAAA